MLSTIGVLANRKHALLSLLYLELAMLSVSILFLQTVYTICDANAMVFALFIVLISGIESAIGLCLLMVFFRAAGHISLKDKRRLKG